MSDKEGFSTPDWPRKPSFSMERVEVLRQKANFGLLSIAERVEYEAYVDEIDDIAIEIATARLQEKRRK
jgi:hypothetical protein